jgi:hypothetical protein
VHALCPAAPPVVVRKGHSRHDVLSVLGAILPGGQAVHAVSPAPMPKLPLGQPTQAGVALAPAYVPGVHCTHAVLEPDGAAPGGQPVHADAPVLAVYRPGKHAAQAGVALAAAYVPGVHWSQADLEAEGTVPGGQGVVHAIVPLLAVYRPGAHAAQTVAPMVWAYVPGTHCAQTVWATAVVAEPCAQNAQAA